MLRHLSIRNFAVIASLDVEFGPGFTVLTGETGAGKSILLDALSLILGDRFEARQVRPGAARAEIAAEFSLEDAPAAQALLVEHALGDGGETALIRRVLDREGKSRAFVNGSAATLAQLKVIGEALVDLHGQHVHQSLGRRDVQRELLDGFGGFRVLTLEVLSAWEAWRAATTARDAAERDAASKGAEREGLERTLDELDRLGLSSDEWAALTQQQSRLAHAAGLIELASSGVEAMLEGDAAMESRLAALAGRLRQGAGLDPALEEIVALVENAAIALGEAGRSLRAYREHLDVDPSELSRVEARIGAIHDVARKYRIQPDAIPALLAQTQGKLAIMAAASDLDTLTRDADQALARYRGLAEQLSDRRALASIDLAQRVTAMLSELALGGGRFEVAIEGLAEPASHGLENVEFRIATHPKQAAGPLARIASGGELSRIGLAIAVALAEVVSVPTLIFDEVDTGIGGAVAATVGRLLRQLGRVRQVLCVTHLPQVAACGDLHALVRKKGDGESVETELEALPRNARVEELARMLGGLEVTARTRAHARELLRSSGSVSGVD